MKKAAIVVLLGLLAARCGYAPVGTGAFLPPHIKKIHVMMFKNLTTRFELDVMLTQSVINELASRGKVETVGDPEQADAVLSGEITSFSVSPLSFSGGDKVSADKYNIVITTSVVLRDRVNQKTIYGNPSYTYLEEYEVPQGSNFESQQTEALTRVAEKFARGLVSNILEGF